MSIVETKKRTKSTAFFVGTVIKVCYSYVKKFLNLVQGFLKNDITTTGNN